MCDTPRLEEKTIEEGRNEDGKIKIYAIYIFGAFRKLRIKAMEVESVKTICATNEEEERRRLERTRY